MHINTPTHLFTRIKAEQLAAKLKHDDPEWQYWPVHPPKDKTGLSKVAIFDETGEFVAYL